MWKESFSLRQESLFRESLGCFTPRLDGPEEEDEHAVWLDAPHLKVGLGSTVRARYRLTRTVVGEGSTSTVWLAFDRNSGRPVAVKQCSKQLLLRLKANSSRVSEVEILGTLQRSCRFPWIPRLLGTFEDSDSLYLVCRLLSGGDLLDHVATRPGFSEQDASRLARKILCMLADLHGQDVAHLDINPTSILFDSLASDNPFLVDFSSAALVGPGVAASSLLECSSPSSPCSSASASMSTVTAAGATCSFFRAPEAASGVLDKSSDMWSLGALLFVVLGGVNPKHTGHPDTSGSLEWMSLQSGRLGPLPPPTSPGSREFLLSLLTVERAERLTASDALLHPWIANPESLPKYPLVTAITYCRDFVSARGRPDTTRKSFWYEANGDRSGAGFEHALQGGRAHWHTAGVPTSCFKAVRGDCVTWATEVSVEKPADPGPRAASMEHISQSAKSTPGRHLSRGISAESQQEENTRIWLRGFSLSRPRTPHT